MKDRIADIIAEYDAQGIHRTGTDVDIASAAWLAERVEALGLEVKRDRFDFERVDLGVNQIETAGLAVDGVPLYDAAFTASDGVAGRLGPVGSDAEIGVALVSSRGGGEAHRRVGEARETKGTHEALVLVTDTSFPPGGVAIINAERFTAPLGPPALQVPNDEWPALEAAMERGERARVTVDNRYVPAEGINIHGRVAGRNPDLAPVVVMTPRSGWWSCASERGGGIAVWLEILRDLAANQPERDVIFTANTGHELGHTGLDHFLAARSGLVQGAHMWVHLGANFVASQGGAPRLQYSDDDVRAAFSRCLEADVAEPFEAPAGTRPGGESRNIFDGGGRFVSIVGGNALFHHPDDTFPSAVDLDAAAGWAKVFVRATRAFAGG